MYRFGAGEGMCFATNKLQGCFQCQSGWGTVFFIKGILFFHTLYNSVISWGPFANCRESPCCSSLPLLDGCHVDSNKFRLGRVLRALCSYQRQNYVAALLPFGKLEAQQWYLQAGKGHGAALRFIIPKAYSGFWNTLEVFQWRCNIFM